MNALLYFSLVSHIKQILDQVYINEFMIRVCNLQTIIAGTS